MIKLPTCKACDSTRLELVLDLGIMPSANNLVAKEELKNVESYPLKYFICQECSLFQLTEFAYNKDLFSDYLYLTGASRMLVEHFRSMSKELALLCKKKELAYVIASNDSTECNLLKEAGFKKVYGIEPSNLGKNKPFIINEFFTYDLSKLIVRTIGQADLVTANNVFAHIPDPKDMLNGMANLINENGIISIEVHWLKSIVEHLEIEALYAEHYFVWSVKSMHMLTQQLGLKIANVIYMPEQHGGSLRFIIKKQGKENLGLMKEEESLNFSNLQQRAEERKQKFNGLIQSIKSQGKSIGIWSVPAKVPTLLNFCGITNKEINYAYEVAPTKIGKFIPMANIEIKNEKELIEDMQDYLIVGAWNYWQLALKVLKPYIEKGGHLINPLTCEVYP